MAKNNTSSQVNYVDGFVLAVPEENMEAYKKMAEEAGEIWMKHGALSYKECRLEDVEPEHVTLTFPQLAQVEPGETVWFSYIEYESKEHRDQVNAKVMEEMHAQMEKHKDEEMPFDMKRMAYGGFSVEVSI